MIERIPLNGGMPAERERDITASVIGALWGVHPWKTIFEIYNEKRGFKIPIRESEVIDRGTELEMMVALKVQRQHPEWKIVKASHYYRDPEARIGATPDYFIEGDPRGLGVLQCKTASSSMFRKGWSDDQPPFWIALQTQTEIMLTEAAFGLIGVLVVGDYVWRLHEYPIPSHEGAQERIRSTVAGFWQTFDQDIRPTPDYTRDRDLIDAIYPNDKPGIAIDLRGDNRILELLDEIEQADADEAAAKAKSEKAKAEIKDKMGDAASALVRGWRVTWKTEERSPYYVPGKPRRVFRSRRMDNG